jgi:zinc protease
VPAALPPGPAILLVDLPGKNQAAVTVGGLGLTGWPAQRALSELTDRLLGARLAETLHAQGLSYAPDVRVGQSSETGVFYATASVPQGRVGPALRAMRAEVDRLRDDTRAWSATSSFRGAAIQAMFHGLQTRDGLEAALVAAINAREAHPLAVQAVEYESVPVSDLRAFAGANFAPGRMVLVVVGDRRVVEPQLAGLGPVTVSSPLP